MPYSGIRCNSYVKIRLTDRQPEEEEEKKRERGEGGRDASNPIQSELWEIAVREGLREGREGSRFAAALHFGSRSRSV